MKSENEKRKAVSSKIIILYLLGILVVIFLSLPLIYQDKQTNIKQNDQEQEQEALPLQSENPFTHYFKLFKNFYSPNRKNEFSKIRHDFQTKSYTANVSEARKARQSLTSKNSANITGTQTTMASKNYYDDEGSAQQYIEEETYPQSYDPSKEIPGTPTKQEPFEDFLMEGLYDTSELDSYEKKLAARRNTKDIVNTNPFVFFPSATQIEKPLTRNTESILTHNNLTKERQNILFNDGTNTNKVSTYANRYINRVFKPFNTTQTIADKIDISNLPFETQAGIVSNKLNTIYITNQGSSGAGNSSSQGNQNNQGGQDNPPAPRPPLPPAPPKDTFDPTKWDPQVDIACSIPPSIATQENTTEQKSAEQETQEDNSDKIEHCDQELQDKLPKVNNNMQQNYNYVLVSGRYKGQIMIPAFNSLSDTILTFGIQSFNQDFLNYPQQLQGKKFSENTKATDFKFAVSLKPQAFNQIMQDDKTILLSVDPEDQNRYPEKTILIQSGEIETFSGVNRIIGEINNFPQKQAELKKAAKEKEKQEKEQKAQDLQDKINSAI